VLRTRRKKVPHSWMAAATDGSFIAEQEAVAAEDMAFEYMLNRTRLAEPIPLAEFAARTGLDLETLAPGLGRALEAGLLERHECVGDVAPIYAECGAEGTFLIRTERGARFLNDLQALFL